MILFISSTLAISPVSAAKAPALTGTTMFTFKVVRGGNTGQAISARWAVAGTGSAAADAHDFAGGVLPAGTLNFAVGETEKLISVPVVYDGVRGLDEMFSVSLSVLQAGQGTVLAVPTATGTIIEPRPLPALAISALAASVKEGRTGSTAFTFVVTRTADTSGTVSVSWSVAGTGGRPAAATDFAGGRFPSGTVTFTPGQTSATITVNVAGDSAAEPNESFRVTLGNPTGGARIATGSADGLIINDDASHAGGMVLSNGMEIFAAPDAAGRSQLWGSDEVTVRQISQALYPQGLQPSRFFLLNNGTATFIGRDATGRSQVWGTDGSSVRQLTTTTYSFGIQASDFTLLKNGREIFSGFDNSGKSQLFGTDGLSVIRLTNVAYTFGLQPGQFQALANGREIFSGHDDSGKSQLYATDGLSVIRLTNVAYTFGLQPGQFQALANGREIFSGHDDSGKSQLYATDGFSVTKLTDIAYVYGLQPGDFLTLGNGREIFAGHDNSGRSQLYATDGFSVTKLTANTSSFGLQPSLFKATANGQQETFRGTDNQGTFRTWITDGTVSGTHLL